MGIINGIGGGRTSRKAGGKLEQFCSKLGWRIDELSGNVIAIPFNTQIGQRHVVAYVGDSGLRGVACMSSEIQISPDQLHEMVPLYFLTRNKHMICGAWKVEQNGSNIEFEAWDVFHMAGLDIAMFKSICEAMANEVGSSILDLRNKGWL